MKLSITIICLSLGTYAGLPVKQSRGLSHTKQNNIYMQQDTLKDPTLIIEKTVVKPMQVLLISDTARVPDLSVLFENDYAELFKFIFAKGLIPGTPMAFHLNYENPMMLEVAVPVNKIPQELTGRIQSKIIEGGNAVVLHYTGTYEELGTAYNKLAGWIKKNNLQSRDLSFEVYINDPSSVKRKDELKTDIYQLIQ